MVIALKAGVSFCVVDGTAIFLDLAADRYFALSASASSDFLRAIAAGNAAESLSRLPFLRFSDDRTAAAAAPVHVRVCERSLVDDTLPSVSSLSVLRAAAEQLWAGTILRHQPLYVSLDAPKSPTEQGASGIWCEDTAVTIAASYQAAGRLVGLTDRCLRFSFAMWRRMRSLRLPVNLVFGVTHRPFAAHCWVQAFDTVCSDRLEHVRWFTPIAVI